MTFRITRFLLPLLLLCLTAARAQQLHIQHFGLTDGFSQADVKGVIQDHEGFIWIAGNDGLWRYDGTAFVNFKARPGDGCPLASNRIIYISEDQEHNIICMLDKRYYLFDRKTERFRNVPDNFTHRRQRFHPSRELQRQTKALPEYKGLEHVYILQRDRQQGLWVYSNRGLERLTWKDDAVAPVKSSKGQEEEVVRALFRDKSGRLWEGDKNGRVRITTKGHTRWLTADGRLSDSEARFGHNVYCVYEDRKGDIWLGAKPGGAFRLHREGDGFKITQYVHDPHDRFSLSCDNVYAIAEDRFGHMLFATYGGGLNIAREDGGRYRFHHSGNGLHMPDGTGNARCLAVLPDGTLLAGTDRGLLAATSNSDILRTTFTVHRREPARAESLVNNIVNDILIANDGTVYLATDGGVDQLLTTRHATPRYRFRHYTVKDGLPSDISRAMAQDRDGRLWVVSESALSCLNPSRGIMAHYVQSFFDGHFVFTEARPALTADGRIAFGTSQGTLAFSPKAMAKSTFVPRIALYCDSVVTLSHDAPNLDLRFAALDLNHRERIVYAYMIEGADSTWHYTEANELHYAALAPGEYRLHVKSTNGDGVWVDNEKVVTIIRRASFGETPWPWILGTAVALLFLLAAYKTVTYISRLERELKDLRLSGNDRMAIVGGQLRELLAIQEMPEEIKATESDGLTEKERSFAERYEAVVTRHLSNADLDVALLASETFVSRTHLYALVKKVYGTSPNNYVLNMRIKEAQRRLSVPGAHIADVAYACGFSDPKYFSRCFRRLTGMSPKEFQGTAEGK